MKSNAIIRTFYDVNDCLKYPYITKKEQTETAVVFWSFVGLPYLIVLAIDKEERKNVGLVAQLHREMANKYKETIITNEQYRNERRQYFVGV